MSPPVPDIQLSRDFHSLAVGSPPTIRHGVGISLRAKVYEAINENL